MTKFFKKSTKPHFGAILGPFDQNLGKNEFSWNIFKARQFLDIFIIYHRAKTQKKIYWPIPEKTDERADGQRWFYRILRRSGVQLKLVLNDAVDLNPSLFEVIYY